MNGPATSRRRWLADTLFWRLFALMWGALVLSHVAAFAVVTLAPWGAHGDAGRPRGLPTFPSLPPTPGLPDTVRPGDRSPGPPPERRVARPPGPPPDSRNDGSPAPPSFEADRSDRPPSGVPRTGGLPVGLLVLDYAVRLLVIAAAAALGARWLATPMRRLVDASSALASTLGGRPGASDATALPLLDERRGTAEVREAARVFNRMARELERQFRSRSLFVAALSHDLKTPLTRLRLRLEADDRSAAATERSAADIREMAALVDSALEVFRSAGGHEQAAAVDVAALVQSLVDDAAERGEAVTLRPPASAVVARGAPVSLKRVLDNVVGNALRYAGAAEVGVSGVGDRIEVTVADCGPGIPPQLLEAVFEPFFRVESSRHRASGGTGLGLYIARDLLARHGGTIDLAARMGGGLVATIVLPRA